MRGKGEVRNTPRRAGEFNDHGFGVAAVEAVAAALSHDLGGCGYCDPGETGESCPVDHHYPAAESALRGLSCVLTPPASPSREENIVAGVPTPEDHRTCLESALAKISLIARGYPQVALSPAESMSLGAELFLRTPPSSRERDVWLWTYVAAPALRALNFLRRLFKKEAP